MYARRPHRRGSARAVVPLLIFALGFAAGAAALHYGLSYLAHLIPPPATTAPAPFVATAAITAKGRLEPAGGIVSVYGPPGDRIREMKVKPGDAVTRDSTLLFVLASRPDRAAERELAERQYEEAKRLYEAIKLAGDAKLKEIDAEIAQATAGKEYDLEALRKQVSLRKKQVEFTEEQWKEASKLTLSKPSEQEKKQHQLTLEQQRGEYFVAEKTLARRTAEYEKGEKAALAKRKTAELEIKQALERVPRDSLKQSLAMAERRLDATEVKSPITGEVLRVVTRPGDTILGPQAILQLADLRQLVLIAEVNVDQVQQLRAWAEAGTCVAHVSRDNVLGGVSLTGKVLPENIAQVVGPSVFKPVLPGESRDRRIVEVRVPLDVESAKAARAFIDLEVAVELKQEGGGPKPDRAAP